MSIQLDKGRDTITGQLVHIDDARNGKACHCVCPDCGAELIARQGEVNDWHFAHVGICTGTKEIAKSVDPIESNASGSWIAVREAVDPRKWVVFFVIIIVAVGLFVCQAGKSKKRYA